jgi:AraC-like DNA-binding protein
MILKHRKNIPYYFSNYSQKNTLTWLILVLVIFLFFFVAIFLLPFFESVLKASFFVFISLPVNLTVFTFIIVFFGINQSVFFEPEKITEPDLITESEKKYERSALKQSQITSISETVYNYLKEKKPYLNSDYSLQMMVDDLDISRQNLSQVINSGQKKNFYKLINEFRVNEVKALLKNSKYEHYTLLGIAFECGFNSKTSFNRIFKEETGVTPTAYKNSL